jgi:hypothetical protein
MKGEAAMCGAYKTIHFGCSRGWCVKMFVVASESKIRKLMLINNTMRCPGRDTCKAPTRSSRLACFTLLPCFLLCTLSVLRCSSRHGVAFLSTCRDRKQQVSRSHWEPSCISCFITTQSIRQEAKLLARVAVFDLSKRFTRWSP